MCDSFVKVEIEVDINDEEIDNAHTPVKCSRNFWTSSLPSGKQDKSTRLLMSDLFKDEPVTGLCQKRVFKQELLEQTTVKKEFIHSSSVLQYPYIGVREQGANSRSTQRDAETIYKFGDEICCDIESPYPISQHISCPDLTAIRVCCRPGAQANIVDYENFENLKENIQKHTKTQRYECNVCGKEFTLNCNLKIHMRTHTGERPYVCHLCGKDFGRTDKLKLHMQTHAGQKPFKCNICDNLFTRKDSLKRHTETHAGEKPYKCGVCSKEFARQTHLEVHMRIHTGEKAYTCNVCGKKFAHKDVLGRHLRTHTAERPYRCKICCKEFTQRFSLNTHVMSVHAGTRPYICSVCNKEFGVRSNIIRHIRTHVTE